MIEVTADTNVFVSALHFAGLPRQILVAAEAGVIRLATSPAILMELQGVLRGKFDWSDDAIQEALSLLAGCTQLVQPTQSLKVVVDDPDDDRVLECAVAAGSKYIVTGDGDLLRLGHYAGIQIVKVVDFLQLLDRSAS